MTTKTTICVAAFAFAGSALGLAWFGFREANAVNAKLAELRRRQSLLNANLKREEDRIPAVTHHGKEINASAPKTQTAPRQPNSQQNAFSREKALLASNPRLLDLKMKSLRAGVSQRFGLFYHVAGLSAEQIEKFEALVLVHERSLDPDFPPSINGVGAVDTGPSGPLKPDEQFELDEKELLGSAAYQQLQEYTREQGALGIIRLAAWYAQPIEPYSGDQVAQLMRLITNPVQSSPQGGTVGWNELFAKAATVLSPEQMGGILYGTGGRLSQLMDTYASQKTDK